MKKILLLAVAALAFAACGNSSSNAEKPAEAAAEHSCTECGGCDKDSTAISATDSTATPCCDSTAKAK